MYRRKSNKHCRTCKICYWEMPIKYDLKHIWDVMKNGWGSTTWARCRNLLINKVDSPRPPSCTIKQPLAVRTLLITFEIIGSSQLSFKGMFSTSNILIESWIRTSDSFSFPWRCSTWNHNNIAYSKSIKNLSTIPHIISLNKHLC